MKVRVVIDICFGKRETEIKQNIDSYSKKIFVANIELLLKYCSRFYGRQFIAREMVFHHLIEKFENVLTNYILSENLQNIGLPSTTYFEEELHLSPNYLADLLKKETGKTPRTDPFENLRLSQRLSSRHRKTIIKIAYELGFKYTQHFTRLFKQ